MPSTPAHLQSFLDAESAGHSSSKRCMQIPFETRLRLTCDGRCSVDSRVHLLNEQADVWTTQIFVILLIVFCVQLVDFTPRNLTPKPLQSQCDFLDFAGVKTGSADQS